jgi:hypothetical protein
MAPAEPELPAVQPGGPLDPLAVRRRATTALIINLVLAVFFLGLLCIPGAVLAAMSMSETHDVRRANRLLRWSWGFLAANLLFYVLLFATVMLIAVYLIFAATR